jgi:hypothetical protein
MQSSLTNVVLCLGIEFRIVEKGRSFIKDVLAQTGYSTEDHLVHNGPFWNLHIVFDHIFEPSFADQAGFDLQPIRARGCLANLGDPEPGYPALDCDCGRAISVDRRPTEISGSISVVH